MPQVIAYLPTLYTQNFMPQNVMILEQCLKLKVIVSPKILHTYRHYMPLDKTYRLIAMLETVLLIQLNRVILRF